MQQTEIVEVTLNSMDLLPCNGCDRCYLRCEADIQMTEEEYRTVVDYCCSAIPIDYLQIVLEQDKSVDLGDEVHVSLCRYYDMVKRGCSVYPARPLICKLMGHVEWLPCPIEKIPLSVKTPDALALMRSYAEVKRRTFQDWDLAVNT